MYGGKFLANGADTCVYDPPVSCDPPNPSIDVENKVSRIVSVTSGEREKQAFLQKVIQDVEPVFPSIRDYVNFATDSCTPKFKPEDEQQSCKVKNLASGQLVNLITPKQGKDFFRLQVTPDFKVKFPTYMMLLATAMSYLNEYGLMHTDLHGANIALMNNKLVAHDWGRSFNSRDEKVLNNYLDWAKRTSALKNRAEYRYIVPILDNSGYFQGLINRTTKAGRNKLQMVLTRSWDTLALIGTSEYEGLITKDAVDKFLSAFVRIVAQKDGDFSVRLREIIPLAFVSSSVIPPAVLPPPPPIKVKKTRKVKSKKTRKSVAPVVAPVVPSPMVAPVVQPPVVMPPVVAPLPVKVRKTRKVNSKPKKTRKVKVVVPPPVVAPVVAPVVPPPAPAIPPAAAPVEPPKSMAKSMYVTPSVSDKEVAELRKDIAACDQEVDELRKKVQDIAALTKLGPRRGGSSVSSKFDHCVKTVRKTVKARKGSNKESAAIGICTKSVLQTRGRTMKRYRKGRLTTQKLL
jgi:hypothetical protein